MPTAAGIGGDNLFRIGDAMMVAIKVIDWVRDDAVRIEFEGVEGSALLKVSEEPDEVMVVVSIAGRNA